MTTLETKPSAPVLRPFSPGVVRAGSRHRVRGGRHQLLLSVGFAGTPVVELLPELEVQEALGRVHAVERADARGHVQQVAPVDAEHLDDDVEAGPP